MGDDLQTAIKRLVSAIGADRGRLVDIIRAIQERFGHVSDSAIDAISEEMGIARVEVEGVVTFYSFFTKEQTGQTVIRLTDCVAARMRGMERVADAFKQALGIDFDQTTPNGKITLRRTSCIGLCDQGPAALCNDVPITYLSSDRVKDVVTTIAASGNPRDLVKTLGEGNNAAQLIQSMVINNIRKRGAVIFDDHCRGEAIKNAAAMTPAEVIRAVKTARLRGRGGAGFPTGMKWEFTRNAPGDRHYVVCNADEGEPGTFKDRVILTEAPDLVFEGMTICGYAIGATAGIMYLRGEYAYLKPYLDDVLARRREDGLLGAQIGGRDGFSFDIEIKLGAGAYVCGEETALIRSAEGGRGEPKNRPPFPAQRGYLDQPTVVNNVETFCCAARIIEKGTPWFTRIGSQASTGTKVFSVSGDCRQPGIYELPYGLSLRQFLAAVGGEDAIAVQVGGPSGTCVSRDGFDRILCFDDLATGGSMMVFGPHRDILGIAAQFMEFFIEESCGWCTPCRVGNVLILERLEKIRAGNGQVGDVEYLTDLCQTVKKMSRCGLGQTSPNPVLTTLHNFRALYETKLVEDPAGLVPAFDLTRALREAVRAQGREPVEHSEA